MILSEDEIEQVLVAKGLETLSYWIYAATTTEEVIVVDGDRPVNMTQLLLMLNVYSYFLEREGWWQGPFSEEEDS